MPHVEKAELIEGTVYMPSPIHFSSHGQPYSTVIGWPTTYVAATPHVSVADNAAVLLDLDNEPHLDALLRIDGRAVSHQCRRRGGPARVPSATRPQILLVEVRIGSARSCHLHEIPASTLPFVALCFFSEGLSRGSTHVVSAPVSFLSTIGGVLPAVIEARTCTASFSLRDERDCDGSPPCTSPPGQDPAEGTRAGVGSLKAVLDLSRPEYGPADSWVVCALPREAEPQPDALLVKFAGVDRHGRIVRQPLYRGHPSTDLGTKGPLITTVRE